MFAGLLAVAVARAGQAPDPAEILRRAEDVRSPDLDYAVDFTISVLDDLTPGHERKAAYSMVADGRSRAMILMLEPEQLHGGTLLIRGAEYWLLLAHSSRAIQLSPDTVLRGDQASGELARTDLSAGYDAKLDGMETVEGEPCFELELTARASDSPFPRVRALVSKGAFRPVQYEYYGRTGTLERTARYLDYRKTPLGVRSMKLRFVSDVQHRVTTLVFSNLRKADPAPIEFTPEGMIPFRDAAMRRP